MYEHATELIFRFHFTAAVLELAETEGYTKCLVFLRLTLGTGIVSYLGGLFDRDQMGWIRYLLVSVVTTMHQVLLGVYLVGNLGSLSNLLLGRTNSVDPWQVVQLSVALGAGLVVLVWAGIWGRVKLANIMDRLEAEEQDEKRKEKEESEEMMRRELGGDDGGQEGDLTGGSAVHLGQI